MSELLKGLRYHQPRILYPVKLSFKTDEEIDFLRKSKLKEFVASTPALKEIWIWIGCKCIVQTLGQTLKKVKKKKV